MAKYSDEDSNEIDEAEMNILSEWIRRLQSVRK